MWTPYIREQISCLIPTSNAMPPDYTSLESEIDGIAHAQFRELYDAPHLIPMPPEWYIGAANSGVVMESSDLAVLDILSPPFLCWFSRDECPHPVLVWGPGAGPAPSWWVLPAGFWPRTVLTAVACTGVALLLWRLRRRASEKAAEVRYVLICLPSRYM